MGRVAVFVIAATLASSATASHAPLAGLAEALDDQERAIAMARTIDLEQRAIADWQGGLAHGLMARGRGDEALPIVQDMQRRHQVIQEAYALVLARYPNNARANNYYGDALFDFAGEEDRAVSHWTKATEYDPDFAPPYISLGNHYTHSGLYAKGLEAFDKAIAVDPQSPEGYYHLVQIYLINWPSLEPLLNKSSQELYAEAIAMSEKASRLAPNDYELARDYALNFFAGDRMQATVDWPKAAQAWERVHILAKSGTMKFQALLYQARAYIRAENSSGAENALVAALKIMPENQVAKDLLEKVRTRDSNAPGN